VLLGELHDGRVQPPAECETGEVLAAPKPCHTEHASQPRAGGRQDVAPRQHGAALGRREETRGMVCLRAEPGDSDRLTAEKHSEHASSHETFPSWPFVVSLSPWTRRSLGGCGQDGGARGIPA